MDWMKAAWTKDRELAIGEQAVHCGILPFGRAFVLHILRAQARYLDCNRP